MALTKVERNEMIEDAKSVPRRKAFQAAQRLAQAGSLDDYIDFLSQNMQWVKVFPTKRITTNNRL